MFFQFFNYKYISACSSLIKNYNLNTEKFILTITEDYFQKIIFKPIHISEKIFTLQYKNMFVKFNNTNKILTISNNLLSSPTHFFIYINHLATIYNDKIYILIQNNNNINLIEFNNSIIIQNQNKIEFLESIINFEYINKLNLVNDYNISIFIKACAKNNIDLCLKIINLIKNEITNGDNYNYSININHKDLIDATAIYYACKNNNYIVIEFLLELNVDVNIICKTSKYSALNIVIINNNLKCIELFKQFNII